MNFPGELSREEDVLEWLITNKSTGDEEDVIEDVTAKTLNTLIGNVDNLVVLFCKYHFLINYYNNYHQNLMNYHHHHILYTKMSVRVYPSVICILMLKFVRMDGSVIFTLAVT